MDHRHSVLKGSPQEQDFWKPMTNEQIAAITDELYQYNRKLRMEKPNNWRTRMLTQTHIEVFRFIANHMNRATGKLFLSDKYISQGMALSENTVLEARRRLTNAGFLEYRKRYTIITSHGRIIATQRLSNIYRLRSPQAAARETPAHIIDLNRRSK